MVNLRIFSLVDFISRDLSSAVIEVPFIQGAYRGLVIDSGYFLVEEEEPKTEPMQKLIQYCKSNNLRLEISHDAYTLRAAWGRRDVHAKGNSLIMIMNPLLHT